MPIMVNCSCGNVMSVTDDLAGMTVVCNQCRRVTAVPAVGPTSPASPAPGQGAVNPYLAQNAGYAAAAAPAGYSQAPSTYHTNQQLGKAPPSRGLLITGGVLAILAYLGCGPWNALFYLAASNGKLTTIPAAVYALLGIAALAGIVFAALSFASMPWAATLSGALQVLFVVVFGITIPEIRDPDAQLAASITAGFTLLGAIFTLLGLRQAKRYRAYRGG